MSALKSYVLNRPPHKIQSVLERKQNIIAKWLINWVLFLNDILKEL